MDSWFYDEKKHSGVDYSDVKQAEIYDERHGKFRDFKKEYEEMMKDLNITNPSNLTMIDLGCGTGGNALFAAKEFKKIIAVDISEVMIEQAKIKAIREKIKNIEFVQNGFLNYRHQGEPADIAISKIAFHHLPDFWKQTALFNINKSLKMKGIFYLYDVVFQFVPEQYEEKINEWISDFREKTGDPIAKEVISHIRDEYSTYQWIIEGMLVRAGFEIFKYKSKDDFMAEYFCYKVREF